MGVVRRFFLRLATLHGTPVGIAGGFTLGLALSLIPLPFLGMFVALALAPLLRLNPPATYLGTAIVNPVTGSAFYFAEMWTGMALTGLDAPRWSDLAELDARGWWDLILEYAGPFALGAVTLACGAVVVIFPLVWWITRSLQRRFAHAPTPASARHQ